MSKDKHEHEHEPAHGKHDDHGKDHHGGSSHDESDHQRKQPTAGVRSHGGRWGDDEEMFDIKGRVLGLSVVGDHLELTLGAGRDQGVHRGMTGLIMDRDTFTAEVDVISVSKRTCVVKVHTTRQEIEQHLDDIVINPSKMPAKAEKKASNFKTRVIGVSIEGDKQKLMIGGGRAYGVNAGDTVLMLDENGKSMGTFVVTASDPRVAHGYVHMANLDEVHRIHSVVVNPS